MFLTFSILLASVAGASSFDELLNDIVTNHGLIFKYDEASHNSTSPAPFEECRTHTTSCGAGMNLDCLLTLAEKVNTTTVQAKILDTLELGILKFGNEVTAAGLRDVALDVACSANVVSLHADQETSHRRKLQGSIELPRPDDPLYLDQWYLDFLKMPAFWLFNNGTSSMKIMIADTGIDKGHPDLYERVDPGLSTFADETSAQDDDGHGTHMAGVVGAVTNNGIGVAGMTWTPSLVPCRFIRDRMGSLSGLLQCVNFAIISDVKMIVMGWTAPQGDTGIWSTISLALRDHGIFFVVAAGNEDKTLSEAESPWPSALKLVNTFSVTAMGEDSRLADFANTDGNSVDYALPGTQILNTDLSPTYKAYSGTSSAAAVAAGLIFLCWSVAPTATAEDLRTLVGESGQSLDDLVGRVRFPIQVDAQMLFDNCDAFTPSS